MEEVDGKHRRIFGNLKAGDYIWAIKKDRTSARRLEVLRVERHIEPWTGERYLKISLDGSYYERFRTLYVYDSSILASYKKCVNSDIYVNRQDVVTLLEGKVESKTAPIYKKYWELEKSGEEELLEKLEQRILAIDYKYQEIYENI